MKINEKPFLRQGDFPRPGTQVSAPSSAEKPGNVAILVNNVNIEIHLTQNIQAYGFRSGLTKRGLTSNLEDKKSGLTSNLEENKEPDSYITKRTSLVES
jgi:hypothetical protein